MIKYGTFCKVLIYLSIKQTFLLGYDIAHIYASGILPFDIDISIHLFGMTFLDINVLSKLLTFAFLVYHVLYKLAH